MSRAFQEGADLFGPECVSFAEAQEWIKGVRLGWVTRFIPTHGKIAGYHIDAREGHVPLQNFSPTWEPATKVTVTFVKRLGDISINGPEEDKRFYPRFRGTVEYEAVDEPASAEVSAPADLDE